MREVFEIGAGAVEFSDDGNFGFDLGLFLGGGRAQEGTEVETVRIDGGVERLGLGLRGGESYASDELELGVLEPAAEVVERELAVGDGRAAAEGADFGVFAIEHAL